MRQTLFAFNVAYLPPMATEGPWNVEQDVLGRWCVVRTEGWFCMVCLTGPLHIEDDRPEERARSLARALNRVYQLRDAWENGVCVNCRRAIQPGETACPVCFP